MKDHSLLKVFVIESTFESYARIFSKAIFLVSFTFRDVFCTNASLRTFEISGFMQSQLSETTVVDHTTSERKGIRRPE